MKSTLRFTTLLTLALPQRAVTGPLQYCHDHIAGSEEVS